VRYCVGGDDESMTTGRGFDRAERSKEWGLFEREKRWVRRRGQRAPDGGKRVPSWTAVSQTWSDALTRPSTARLRVSRLRWFGLSKMLI
jgi:hypothetical protein